MSREISSNRSEAANASSSTAGSRSKVIPLHSREGWTNLLFLAIIISSLELLWSIPAGRLPLYWLPIWTPLPAILLNSILQIAIFLAAAVFSGTVFLAIFRQRWATHLPLLALPALYAIYMGNTIWHRYWALYDDDSWLQITTVTVVWTIAVVVVSAGFYLNRARRGRGFPGNLAWPITVSLSLIIATMNVVLRWLRWFNGGTLLAMIGFLTAGHLGLWLLTRKWRPSWRWIGGLLLILALAASAVRGIWAGLGRPPTTPHIIAVLWDAVRADRMSAYGYESPTTPFAASLAKEGLNFSSAHSTSNYTFPSHASIFSGLYCREHNRWKGYGQIGRPVTMVADVLKERGYRTIFLTENI
jgi:hypothetical protein